MSVTSRFVQRIAARTAAGQHRTAVTQRLFSSQSHHQQQQQSSSKQQNSRSWLLAALGSGVGLALTGAGVALADSKSQQHHDRPYDGQHVNYNEVRKEIANILDKEGYDDGSLGPLFVRLAWHSSGSYSAADGNGGSNGAHIRYGPQKFWGGNAGINTAIEELEPVKKKHPGISYGDLYTLCGVVAIEEMGGPVIPWRPGRVDHEDGSSSPQQDNRLPDGAKGADHIRDVFYRMGFGDREIVALSGAHALGRCHRDRSGFDGPWTRAPTTFSNEYFKLLLNDEWTERKWDGPRQFTNSKSGNDLMMLPSDMALIWDSNMREWVEKYAADDELFFEDFSASFGKLLELGVSFHSSEAKKWYHKVVG